MIYSHKPQRSGRSIQANTNNPPQDPPPPKDTLTEIPIKDTIITPLDLQIPDILIEDSTPSIPETCIEEQPILKIPEKKIPKPQITKIQKQTPKVTPKIPQKVTPKIPPKVSFFRRIIIKILRIFGRK